MILSLSPSTVTEGDEVAVEIRGSFEVGVHVSYANSSRSFVDVEFTAQLGTLGLVGVRWVDARTLRATVPDGLPVGAYDLVVIDPRGNRASLTAAFEVEPRVSMGDGGGGGDPLPGGDTPTPGDPILAGDELCTGNRCDWWDPAWPRRVRIDVDNSAAAEDLVEFPVRVWLDGTRIEYSHTASGGDDLRFVDGASGAILPHEVELWDPAGTSELWVGVPLIPAGSTDTQFWLYYDNDGAADAQDPTAVWSAGFEMVLHLGEEVTDEATDGQHLDSTGHGNHGNQSGNEDQPALIGRGQSFDGVDDHVVLAPDLSTGMLDFTFSAWVHWTGGGAYQRIFDFNDGLATSSGGAYVYATPRTNNGSGNGRLFFAMTLAGYNNDIQASTGPLSVETWQQVVMMRDGDTLRLFVDGQLAASDPVDDTISLTTIAAVNHWLGRSAFGDADPYLSATLDEVRFAGVARGASWVAAAHASTAGGFVTLLPTEIIDP